MKNNSTSTSITLKDLEKAIDLIEHFPRYYANLSTMDKLDISKYGRIEMENNNIIPERPDIVKFSSMIIPDESVPENVIHVKRGDETVQTMYFNNGELFVLDKEAFKNNSYWSEWMCNAIEETLGK